MRLSLPFFSASGALHVFPWLERAAWAHCPSLRPAAAAGKLGGEMRERRAATAGTYQGCQQHPAPPHPGPHALHPCAGLPGYQPAASSAVAAGLARLAAVHEALEDATRGMPDAAREAVAVGVLAAAGAAVLRGHMRPGVAEALLALRCLDPLVS